MGAVNRTAVNTKAAVVSKAAVVHKTSVYRVGVLSMAKVQGLISAIFGLIIGIIYALLLLALGSAVGGTGAQGSMGLLGNFGFLAVIIAPIVYGIGGFIAGAIGALFYNLAAKWVGGIQLSLKEL